MHLCWTNILIFTTSSTCFEPEGSSSGRRFYMRIWYTSSVFCVQGYKQSCRWKRPEFSSRYDCNVRLLCPRLEVSGTRCLQEWVVAWSQCENSKQDRSHPYQNTDPCLLTLTFNPLNAELNPICHLLTLLGAYHILHVSRIRVKNRTSYI